jgi:hypothetical protein
METYTKQRLIGRKDYDSILSRFKDKVGIDKETGCWIWLGKITDKGYGHFSLDGKMQRANIVSWRLFIGDVESNFDVCHNCPCGDEPSCVNPDHLYLDTRSNHLKESYKKGQRDATKYANKTRLNNLLFNQKISIEEVKSIIMLYDSHLFSDEEIMDWINEKRRI